MPQLAIERSDPQVAILSLDDIVPARVVGLVWHAERYRSPATQAFIDLAEQLGAELFPAAGAGARAQG
jgi:DNA-binding transcriptional LysR family regulator